MCNSQRLEIINGIKSSVYLAAECIYLVRKLTQFASHSGLVSLSLPFSLSPYSFLASFSFPSRHSFISSFSFPFALFFPYFTFSLFLPFTFSSSNRPFFFFSSPSPSIYSPIPSFSLLFFSFSYLLSSPPLPFFLQLFLF